MSPVLSVTTGQIAASAVTDMTRCPNCHSNNGVIFEFTARRPFFRLIQNGAAEPDQFRQEVLTHLEVVACSACAMRLTVVSDADYENRKALVAAREELARSQASAEPGAAKVIVH